MQACRLWQSKVNASLNPEGGSYDVKRQGQERTHTDARMYTLTPRRVHREAKTRRSESREEVMLIKVKSSISVPGQKRGVEYHGLAVVRVKTNENPDQC